MVTARDLYHRLKLRLAMGVLDTPSPDAVLIPRLDWVQNPDQQAFLRAIEQNPNDDAPRLIYADWLDENNNPLAAARMRWFVKGLREHFDPERLKTVGQYAQHLANTSEVRRTNAVRALFAHHGYEGVNAYNSLFNRIMHQVQPNWWDSIQSGGYINMDADKLRKNLGGVDLANELMSLGALPTNFYSAVERAGQHNLNEINTYMPYRQGQPTPFAGHMLALHNQAHAGAAHALGIGVYPHGGDADSMSTLVYPSRIMARRAANSAAAKMAENQTGVLVPQVFNRHNTEYEHIGAGLAMHPHWGSFPQDETPEPKHLSRQPRLHQFMRAAVALKLAADLPMAESFTAPERQRLESFKTKTAGEYREHITGINDPQSQPFQSVTPHVQTLTTLAQIGEPARGEYHSTYHAVKDLFAHDPEGVTAWMGLNGVFSPQTAYKHHAGAASMLTAAWLNAKKPRDEETIRRLIEAVDTFGKHYDAKIPRSKWQINPKTGKYSGITPNQDETFGGTMRNEMNIAAATHVLQNTEKLWEALNDPTGQGGHNLEMLGGGGVSKVPNFVVSYMTPMFGTALDTHMSRLLLHPDLDSFERHSDILRQVRAHLPPADGKVMGDLEKKSLKGVPVKSELVKMLMKAPMLRVKTGMGGKLAETTVSNWLKTINTKLLEKPQHYLAYKYAVNEAAKKLGWKPAEVQESVWTALLGLMAANSVNIPHEDIPKHLTADALRKGWQNHEAIYYPKLVDTLLRGGANPATLRKLGTRLIQRAAEGSRPGVLRVGNVADLPGIAAHLPTIGNAPGHAARPIVEALRRKLGEQGLLDPVTGKYRLRREGEPLRLMAKYDRPLDFGPSLDRVMSANQGPLVQALHDALLRSGINPQHIAPAVHDFGGMTRASILAIGHASNPTAAATGTAWTGLLGRQPGMVSFKGNPRGKDSVYVFHHHNADIVRNVLQAAGVASRTIVPEHAHYKVYVYDPGNKYRAGMAQALTQLGARAIEWRGDGKEIGGETEDMGRSQYRDQINQSESHHFARMVPTDLALLRGVQQKPRDDARWLIMADWYEENGKPNFAHFLRKLVAAAPTRPPSFPIPRRFLGPGQRSVAYGPYRREVMALPGPLFASTSINSVLGASGQVHSAPLSASLLHGFYGSPTPEPQPYGVVQVKSTGGRTLGHGVVSPEELHGIVTESEPRKVHGVYETFHGKSYWEHFQNKLREAISRKTQASTAPSEPHTNPPSES